MLRLLTLSATKRVLGPVHAGPVPQVLAVRRLNLDHVRAGLGEEEARVPAAVDLAEIEDAQPGERQLAHRTIARRNAIPLFWVIS